MYTVYTGLVPPSGGTWLELSAVCAFEITQENVSNESRRRKMELWETLTFERKVYEKKP